MRENLRDPSSRAASQVLKFEPSANRTKRVTEVYLNDGKDISASTVAAPFRDLLVIGSVTDHRVLVCKHGASAAAALVSPEKRNLSARYFSGRACSDCATIFHGAEMPVRCQTFT